MFPQLLSGPIRFSQLHQVPSVFLSSHQILRLDQFSQITSGSLRSHQVLSASVSSQILSGSLSFHQFLSGSRQFPSNSISCCQVVSDSVRFCQLRSALRLHQFPSGSDSFHQVLSVSLSSFLRFHQDPSGSVSFPQLVSVPSDSMSVRSHQVPRVPSASSGSVSFPQFPSGLVRCCQARLMGGCLRTGSGEGLRGGAAGPTGPGAAALSRAELDGPGLNPAPAEPRPSPRGWSRAPAGPGRGRRRGRGRGLAEGPARHLHGGRLGRGGAAEDGAGAGGGRWGPTRCGWWGSKPHPGRRACAARSRAFWRPLLRARARAGPCGRGPACEGVHHPPLLALRREGGGGLRARASAPTLPWGDAARAARAARAWGAACSLASWPAAPSAQQPGGPGAKTRGACAWGGGGAAA